MRSIHTGTHHAGTHHGGALTGDDLLSRWPARSTTRLVSWAPSWLTERRMLIVGVISFCAIVARRPDALFNAQFWAEDGNFWYPQAYALGGAHALVLPEAGYFQTYSRLISWIAVAFPLLYAPLIFALAAIAAQMLPPLLLVSTRFDILLPDWRVRWALIALYLALPGPGEIDANLTNAQWHLSVAMLLILLGSPPYGKWAHGFDLVLLLIGGLTGPFSLFLLPIIAYAWWMTRWSREHATRLLLFFVIDAITAGIQLFALLFLTSDRHHVSLVLTRENLSLLVHFLGGQLVLGFTLGTWGYTQIQPTALWQHAWIPGALTLALAALFVLALLKAPWELKAFIAFACFQLAATLLLVSDPTTVWSIFAVPGLAERYCATPLLAVGATLIWLATRADWRVLQCVALGVLFLTLLVGIPRDWAYTPYTDLHWAAYVARFEALPHGAAIAIPINPGSGWQMQLIKR